HRIEGFAPHQPDGWLLDEAQADQPLVDQPDTGLEDEAPDAESDRVGCDVGQQDEAPHQVPPGEGPVEQEGHRHADDVACGDGDCTEKGHIPEGAPESGAQASGRIEALHEVAKADPRRVGPLGDGEEVDILEADDEARKHGEVVDQQHRGCRRREQRVGDRGAAEAPHQLGRGAEAGWINLERDGPPQFLHPDSSARRSLAQADWRWMSSVSRRTRSVSSCSPAARRITIRKAIAPISAMGCRTVVREGTDQAARGRSSNPITATSPGTDTPCSWRAVMAPSAIKSLAQKSARGSGLPSASHLDTTRYPDGWVKSPSPIHSGGSSRPTSCRASRAPRTRSTADWIVD